MCTVTWRGRLDGYDLFFNRDELDRRAPELPPRSGKIDNVAFLAPRDGDSGGTWLLVNHHGVTVCLLNDYTDPWSPPVEVPLSRGRIVLACATARDSHEALGLAQVQPLACCRPFQLLALAPGHPPARLRWRGGRTEIDRGPAPPLSSSSWNTAAVIAAREAAHARRVDGASGAQIVRRLWRYHRDHDPDRGALSVLMRRPDAATRSIIHVAVGAAAIRLHYRAVGRTPSSAATNAIRLSLARAAHESVARAQT